MRIYSVFVILDDGRCIYHQSLTEEAPPYSLITGLLTAMQSFVYEVTGSYPTQLSAGNFSFHMEKYGPLTVVITTSHEHIPLDSLSELGLKFMQRFGDKVEKWKGKLSDFENFNIDVEKVLGKSTIKKRIDPKQPLNSITLLSLDPELQNVAKALIEVGRSTSYDLSRMTKVNEYQTRMQLVKLVKLGHIGRIQQNDEFVYFII